MQLTPTIKWSNGKGSMMEELAKEELQVLESQYPNQFEYLKLELRSFMLQLQSQHHDSQLLPENNHFSTFLTSHVNTQESTSLEQRKRSNYDLELVLGDRVVMEGKIDESSEHESLKTAGMKQHYSGRKKRRKDRVDLVLERAQACLEKIRHLKSSLLSPSPEISM